MSLKIFNTLSRKKEDFVSLKPNQVTMYVCGPTVYSKAHIGHAMSSIVFDIIRRYLEFKGYRVHHVMNYTDVDDKIIQRAQIQNRDPFELAESYAKEFDKHLQDLNILPPMVKPRATQTMPQIIQMVQALIEKGYAYTVNGDVYFRVQKDEDYGKLSRRKLEEMQAGARIDVDERKEHPMDFALWKAAKEGEPAWDSPWGKGRPGWHIECSAMNLAHLGEQIDIHGGGNDLIFPHHENEIAQSESLTGKPFAKYWVHNGMLQLAGEKMSKSLGNLVTIEKFLQQNDANVLRLMVLNSSYRSPLTFSDEVVNQTKRALERLRLALNPAIETEGNTPEKQAAALALHEQIEKTKQGFIDCMDDDFNTAGAMGYLFELVKAINQARDAGVNSDTLTVGQNTLKELSSVLGLTLEPVSSSCPQMEIAPLVDILIDIRKELREKKLFELADNIRDKLKIIGIIIEDQKGYTTWRLE